MITANESQNFSDFNAIPYQAVLFFSFIFFFSGEFRTSAKHNPLWQGTSARSAAQTSTPRSPSHFHFLLLLLRGIPRHQKGGLTLWQPVDGRSFSSPPSAADFFSFFCPFCPSSSSLSRRPSSSVGSFVFVAARAGRSTFLRPRLLKIPFDSVGSCKAHPFRELPAVSFRHDLRFSLPGRLETS